MYRVRVRVRVGVGDGVRVRVSVKVTIIGLPARAGTRGTRGWEWGYGLRIYGNGFRIKGT